MSMPIARRTFAPRYFRDIVASKYSENIGWILTREVSQNSIDAGARNLFVTTGRDEHGEWIEFLDDGPGMPTVLHMLSIGAATKSDGAGGFGTAKEVVLFHWDRWILESRSERVTSEIAEREGEVERLAEPLSGTRIRLWHGGRVHRSHVRRYLGMLNGIRAHLDGDLIAPFRKGTLRNEMEWADLYTNSGDKAPAKGKIVVRWEGITMYETWIDREDLQITLQLKGRCIDLLKENREQLKYPYESYLWQLRREFEKNPLSRGAVAQEDEIDLFLGAGMVTLAESEYDEAEAIERIARPSVPTPEVAVPKTTSERVKELAEDLTLAYRSGHEFEEVFGGAAKAGGPSGADNGVPVAALLPILPDDVRTAFDAWRASPPPTRDVEGHRTGSDSPSPSATHDPEAPTHPAHLPGASEYQDRQRFGPRRQSRQRHYPRDYAVKRVNGRRCRLDLEQERYGRILFGWEAAVEACLKAAEWRRRRLESRDRKFRVGFIVEGDERAENLVVGNHRYFLLDPREIQTSDSLTDIAQRLLSLATHEVAHIWADHGELFDAIWMELLLAVRVADLTRDDRVRCVSTTHREVLEHLLEG